MNKYQKGFTLIELLVVIGIIAVLIGVFVTTINLGRPFEQARDAQRFSNVSAIASSIKSRMADNRGVWTSNVDCPAISATATYILASESAPVTGTVDSIDYVNLQNCLVDRYMLVIPGDPSAPSSASDEGLTGYQVSITANRVTVSAPWYEGDALPTITN